MNLLVLIYVAETIPQPILLLDKHAFQIIQNYGLKSVAHSLLLAQMVFTLAQESRVLQPKKRQAKHTADG